MVNTLIYFIDKKIQLKNAMDEGIALKYLLKQKENELDKLENELNISGSIPTTLIEKIKSLKNVIEKIKKDEMILNPFRRFI